MPTSFAFTCLLTVLVLVSACDGTATETAAPSAMLTLSGEPADEYKPSATGEAGYSAFPRSSEGALEYRVSLGFRSAEQGPAFHRIQVLLRSPLAVGAVYEIGLDPPTVTFPGDEEGEVPAAATLTLGGSATRNNRPLAYFASSGTLQITALSDSTIAGRFAADLVRNQDDSRDGRFTPVLGRAEGEFVASEERVVLLGE